MDWSITLFERPFTIRNAFVLILKKGRPLSEGQFLKIDGEAKINLAPDEVAIVIYLKGGKK